MRLAAAHSETFPTLNHLHLMASCDLFVVWDDKKTSVKAAWQNKLWLTLQARYTDGAHFSSYERDLDRLFHTHFERRADFDSEMLRLCMAWFDIETPIAHANQNESPVDLCKRFDVSTYLTDTDVDATLFEKACVRLEWHRFTHPSKDVAALDLLLQHGPRSRDLLHGAQPPPLQWWLIGTPQVARGRARR